jgi:hypothetical protein
MTTETFPLARRVVETDQRRAVRRDVALDTMMANRAGESFPARIVNLSESGFLIVTDQILHQRAPVRLDVPTIGWLRADVVWVLGEKVGGAFREPISPRDFAQFVGLFGATPTG